MDRVKIQSLLLFIFNGLVCSLFCTIQIYGQLYPDHIGSGNYVGVQVNVGDTLTNTQGIDVLTGEELFPDLPAASRFLGQATLGHNWEDIEYVNSIGIKTWLDEQMTMPFQNFKDRHAEINNDILNNIGASLYTDRHEQIAFAFYGKVFQDEATLRLKVANALSQIIVTNLGYGVNFKKATGMAAYFDFLYEDAFGNFRDILQNVTLSIQMGSYLTYFQNHKSDFGLKVFPDENYAREIMQLFTIGLFELNNDGTHKLDANGNSIPTYDIYDIQELAKVFTGLGAAAYVDGNTNTTFSEVSHTPLATELPLKSFEQFHSKVSKRMIDGTILPPGRTALEDINDALDILFNHPNVGPFIGHLMIQHLVKSNPSPAYVNRVASAFNNNGQGVRGDMGAVVRAILLDPEARDCSLVDDPTTGKLMQPLERCLKLAKAFDINSSSGRIYIRDENEFIELEQTFWQAPSVFNFFEPNFAEAEFVQEENLVSPEFQILNTNTAIHYINKVENMVDKSYSTLYNYVFSNSGMVGLNRGSTQRLTLDFSDEISTYQTQGISGLLDRLDILLCGGNLTAGTRSIITDAINDNIANVNGYNSTQATKDIIYFVMISDFPIQK